MKTPAVIVACLCVVFFGCTKEPSKPSEAEIQANAIIQATFRGNAESWFGAQNMVGGSKPRLVELHKPHSNLFAQPVAETDRMNGVTDRFQVTLTCEQYRWWDGKWSEWKEGTGGGAKDLVNALAGGAFSVWSMAFEKKNGEWHVRKAISTQDFRTDKALLESLMKNAGVQ